MLAMQLLAAQRTCPDTKSPSTSIVRTALHLPQRRQLSSDMLPKGYQLARPTEADDNQSQPHHQLHSGPPTQNQDQFHDHLQGQLLGPPAIYHPFPTYFPTYMNPCAIEDRKCSPFHLLECGHIIAVDAMDQRCALNCMHVVEYVKLHERELRREQDLDLRPGLTLLQAITKSKPCRQPPELRPPVSQVQAHDSLVCEICNGIPMDRWSVLNVHNAEAREYPLRRSLSVTRQILKLMAPKSEGQIKCTIAPLFYNPPNAIIPWRSVHNLCCNHQVWCEPARPCAPNCARDGSCPGMDAQGTRHVDAIICKECLTRAERVYERYSQLDYFTRQPSSAQDAVLTNEQNVHSVHG